MPIFHAIAAMSENRVIGDRGKIPWHLSEDFRWFKHKTLGGTLIMGRKTFESIGKPLPGRKTLVLTRRNSSGPGGAPSVSLASLIKLEPDQTYWVCGGAEIYRQFLPRCAALYLTRVKREVAGDAFFPPFEESFALDQILRDGDDFRIERWQRRNLGPVEMLPPDQWNPQITSPPQNFMTAPRSPEPAEGSVRFCHGEPENLEVC